MLNTNHFIKIAVATLVPNALFVLEAGRRIQVVLVSTNQFLIHVVPDHGLNESALKRSRVIRGILQQSHNLVLRNRRPCYGVGETSGDFVGFLDHKSIIVLRQGLCRSCQFHYVLLAYRCNNASLAQAATGRNAGSCRSDVVEAVSDFAVNRKAFAGEKRLQSSRIVTPELDSLAGDRVTSRHHSCSAIVAVITKQEAKPLYFRYYRAVHTVCDFGIEEHVGVLQSQAIIQCIPVVILN